MKDASKRLLVSGAPAAAVLPAGDALAAEHFVWADHLYAGPVPSGLSLEEMSRMRARFVSVHLEGRSFEEVLGLFNERDSLLKSFKRFDEVTLRFGTGLDEQMRLVQVLAWFAQRELGRTILSLFYAPARASRTELEGLHSQRREVSKDELALAERAWNALCSDRPLDLEVLAQEELAQLPFLRAALLRHLEQLPWTRDGLSRTERQILQALVDGSARLADVYRESQVEREEEPFMALQPFLHRIRTICGGRPNLVEFLEGPPLTEEDGPPYAETIWKRSLRLTDIGRKILMGQADCVRLYGIDRWLGGVRLHGSRAAWRWDGRRRVVVALSA